MTKYILITGSTSGIGKEIALQLSKKNNLILHGRNLDKIKNLKKLIRNNNHIEWVQDFSKDESISKSLGKLLDDNNIGIEAFIHAAGEVSILPARNLSYELGRKIMKVNYFSAMEIISLLCKKKYFEYLENILFISSIYSDYGARYHTFYSGSKAALNGSMKALSLELSPKVRVNSLILGAIDTPMTAKALSNKKIYQKFKNDYPLGIGDVVDVCETVKFLLSKKSKWLTGQNFYLDGGRTANISPEL